MAFCAVVVWRGREEDRAAADGPRRTTVVGRPPRRRLQHVLGCCYRRLPRFKCVSRRECVDQRRVFDKTMANVVGRVCPARRRWRSRSDATDATCIVHGVARPAAEPDRPRRRGRREVTLPRDGMPAHRPCLLRVATVTRRAQVVAGRAGAPADPAPRACHLLRLDDDPSPPIRRAAGRSGAQRASER